MNIAVVSIEITDRYRYDEFEAYEPNCSVTVWRDSRNAWTS